MKPENPVRIERHDDVAMVIVSNPPVNALSQAVRAGLADAFEELRADGAVTAIVLACAGRTFIAGADIREFGKPMQPPQLTDIIAAIEESPKPVVAAIHGTALGGGFEVALGCHYRVMQADAEVGLPEVTLGIIPGAGGTQRLPRLTGFAMAIDIITSARRVSAREAEEIGIADLVVEKDVRGAAIALAREKVATGGPHPVTSRRALPQFHLAEFVEAAARVANRARGQISPVKAVESIRNAAEMPFSEGLRREREIFSQLVTSDQAAALRYAFFGAREVGKMPGLEKVEPKRVESAVVIGAGTMGSGIAIALADAGLPVVVVETDEAALERGRERIGSHYRAQTERGRIDAASRDRRLTLIDYTCALEKCDSADLYLEAVFEDMAVKKEVFARLDAVAPEGAMLATNTSYLDVNEIAAATRRPSSVVGLHFFSPANVMKLIEVIRGDATAPEMLAGAMALAKRLGKVGVVAGVCEGFIGNRILNSYRRQAEYMLEEGAYPQDVDAAMVAFGFPMGPFAVSDLAGLDIAWANRKRLAAHRDRRERYVDIADRLCEAGRFGRKTGAGWYLYRAGAKRGEVDPQVSAIVEAASREKGITRRSFAHGDIQRRLLAAMINEGARIMEEGIAARAVDVDQVMLNGYGFPRWRGGPMFAADQRGLAQVLKDVREMCLAGGFGWSPAPLLEELAGRNGASIVGWRRRDPR